MYLQNCTATAAEFLNFWCSDSNLLKSKQVEPVLNICSWGSIQWVPSDDKKSAILHFILRQDNHVTFLNVEINVMLKIGFLLEIL